MTNNSNNLVDQNLRAALMAFRKADDFLSAAIAHCDDGDLKEILRTRESLGMSFHKLLETIETTNSQGNDDVADADNDIDNSSGMRCWLYRSQDANF